jgi:hypothetical protein
MYVCSTYVYMYVCMCVCVCVNTTPTSSILLTVCHMVIIHFRRRKQNNEGLDPMSKNGGIILKRVVKRIWFE